MHEAQLENKGIIRDSGVQKVGARAGPESQVLVRVQVAFHQGFGGYIKESRRDSKHRKILVNLFALINTRRCRHIDRALLFDRTDKKRRLRPLRKIKGESRHRGYHVTDLFFLYDCVYRCSSQKGIILGSGLNISEAGWNRRCLVPRVKKALSRNWFKKAIWRIASNVHSERKIFAIFKFNQI